MAILYVIAASVLLIWHMWRQEVQGRLYPFVGISCLYGIWLLANGSTIPMDGLTIATLSLALWIFISLLWSSQGYCVLEIINWFSYLLLFTAARSIPLELSAWIILPNAAILSALQLYYQSLKSRQGHGWETLQFPVFGNTNHNASFLLTGFYAALWLCLNETAALAPFVILIGIAIGRSKCRGATLALAVSLLCVTVIVHSEVLCYISGAVITVAVFNGARLFHTIMGGSFRDRVGIYRDAFKRIHPRWITGRGMNFFRAVPYGRVHNDHIELIGEIGIIGYLLFLNIFLQITFDPIIFSALIAFFIAGLFFYPLREIHTVTPFWVLMGAAGGFAPTIQSYFPILRIVGVLSLLATIIYIFTVYFHLVEWHVAQVKKQEAKA